MKCRRLAVIDAELDYRDVGFRKHMLQNDPRPVVEAPYGITVDGYLQLKHGLNLLCQRWISGSRILLLIEFGWESAHVVSHRGMFVGGDQQAIVGQPVCRNRKNGFWLWDGGADVTPCSGPLVRFDCVHGAAMSDE